MGISAPKKKLRCQTQWRKEKWVHKTINESNICLPHLCVSFTVTMKYRLSTFTPGIALVWKNLTKALPIAVFASLLFVDHGPVSILVCTVVLFTLCELDLLNLPNKPPCCWDEPPLCSYPPLYCRTCKLFILSRGMECTLQFIVIGINAMYDIAFGGHPLS
jgi:hypothetical protein